MEEEIYDDADEEINGAGGEDIYDDGEAEAEATTPAKPKPKPPISIKPQINGHRPVLGTKPSPNAKPAAADTTGMSVKERLALLKAKDTNFGQRPPIQAKPKFEKNGEDIPATTGATPNGTTLIGTKKKYNNNNNYPVIVSHADLVNRTKSLKVQKSPFEQGKPVENTPKEEYFTDSKDKRKFRKLQLVRKPSTSKPQSLEAVTLPIIQYLDKDGVEMRIGAGREGLEASCSLIESLGEEEELGEETPPPPPPSRGPKLPGQPQLPSRPPPTPPPSSSNSVSTKRTPAPPLPATNKVNSTIEELYDEGAAEGASAFDEQQEIYEEFDENDENESNATSLSSSTKPSIETPPKEPSPEPTRKPSKADKEREKKEKEEQKRVEKLRQKETKLQQEIIKKYKITDEELVSSHHVKVMKEQSSGKHNLPVKVGDILALVKKLDNPAGKWVVKNTSTQHVGLVDADGMHDLEVTEDESIEEEPEPGFGGEDEEVYEEIGA